MTIKECYEKMSGDYDDVIGRLGSDSLVERFLLKYPDEKSMGELRDAVNAKDIKASFGAAHTLKGVAANLSLTTLVKAASELTEQLRPLEAEADETLYVNVEEAYKLCVDTIKEYSEQK